MDTLLLRPRRVNAFICVILLVQRTQSVTLEKASSLCLSRPCQNGGECRDDPTTFLCQCRASAASLSSMPCPSSNALCQPPICQANATCQLTGAQPGELACSCAPGSPGHTCPAAAQLCARSRCGGSVRCVPVARGGPRYVCLCQPGYAGVLCQRRADQCTPNPCRNHAICRSRAEGPACFCVPGFQGERCEVEVNECASEPCRNGATCLDSTGHYSCLCTPGYTGVSCEVQTDECLSLPCRHGGSCHDHINSFSCTCPTGFQGDRCEIDIDDCIGHGCQNGALCIDGINSYRCDCSQSDFSGSRCEVPLPPCWSQPCANGALCQEEGGNYTCKCLPGFEGRRCELDVKECDSGPCRNGGVCVELSWEPHNASESLLSGSYHPGRTAGYVCTCPPGFTGALCEEDIDDCSSSPCENSGSCEDAFGGYVCTCSSESRGGVLYGGQNCTEPLVGCERHACQNGAACLPSLRAGVHSYRCSCPPGHSGARCQTPTAFSFGSTGSHVKLHTPRPDADAPSNFTLSFRTVLEDSVLVRRGGGGALLTLELQGGHLQLSLQREAGDGSGWVLRLPQDTADGEWHAVEATLGGGTLLLQLLAPCRGERCRVSAQVEAALLSAFWTILIGGHVQGGASGSFIGCMRDVFVDSQLIGPEDWLNASAVNITRGCIHRDRCTDAPCGNQGECVNLWQGYQCRCQRPYEGQNCADEYIPARFGQDNASSYAVFIVDDEPDAAVATLSVLVRTRRASGVLLALAAGTGPYLWVWLEHGRLKVSVDGARNVVGEGTVSDGEVHFVSVTIGLGRVTLRRSGTVARGSAASPVHVRTGDRVYVGGTDDVQATAGFGGYFKGCMQDLRLNEQRLQFFPLNIGVRSYSAERLLNVSEGCVAEHSCASSPCQNGGVCVPAWDDVTCACGPAFFGRHCEEVRWCELSPCSLSAQCRPVHRGYECISNVTFQNGVTLTFRGNGLISRHLTSISFSIRTRQRNTALLHADNGSGFVTVSLCDGFLALELLSPSSSTPSSSSSPLLLRSTRPIADGTWHGVELHMVNPAANASQWALLLADDPEKPVNSDSEAGNLDFLREGVDIRIGGLGTGEDHSSVVCLSNVEIGGIVLPYYGSADLTLPRPQTEQFQKTCAASLPTGCRADGAACESSPCLNGGLCKDLLGLSHCTCPSGWTGQRCELRAGACGCEAETDPCGRRRCADGATCLPDLGMTPCLCARNFTDPNCTGSKLPASICGDETQNYTCYNGGNCSDADFTCDCSSGFAGRWCEQEADPCRSYPCWNGGYCLSLVGSFHCLCEQDYAGDVCQIDMTRASGAGLPLWASLVSAPLLVALLAASAVLALALARRQRATRGTYSPSRQEKEGSRVEMWNISQPPPTERLI